MAQVEKCYFEEIRARCLSAGVLYEDKAFPAVLESVYFSKLDRRPRIQWRRPRVCDGLTACALLCTVCFMTVLVKCTASCCAGLWRM